MRSALVMIACACLGTACKSKKPQAPAPAPLEVLVPPPAVVVDWHPPEPAEGADDWIRLKSGEWLRGDIEVMRRDSLEFDSDELDTLSLDWKDVVEVRTTRSMTLGLTESRVVTGTLRIVDDTVGVRSPEVQYFSRDELLSIIPGIPSEKNFWSGKIGLSTSMRRGNTNQTDGTADLRILRRSPSSRTELKYYGTLTRVDSVETSNAHRLDGRWDRYLSRRFYVTPIFFEALQDRFQNIDMRFTPGTGVGYALVDDGKLEWNVDTGLGYQLLRYDSVEPDEPSRQESAAALLGTQLRMDVTEKVELTFEYRLQASFDSEVGTNHHSNLELSVDVIGDLDLDLAFLWDHIGKPVTDSTGVTPTPDDFRITAGFSWSF